MQEMQVPSSSPHFSLYSGLIFSPLVYGTSTLIMHCDTKDNTVTGCSCPYPLSGRSYKFHLCLWVFDQWQNLLWANSRPDQALATGMQHSRKWTSQHLEIACLKCIYPYQTLIAGPATGIQSSPDPMCLCRFMML